MTLLLVRPGSVLDEVRAVHGDFDDWFAAALPSAEMHVVDPTTGPLPESLDAYRGVLVTGSHAAAYDDELWVRDLEDLLRRVALRSLPTLGVCFGHQVLATALGGRVERHPDGREIGTVTVELTPAGTHDPLLGALPATFEAQAVHDDHVVELPANAEILATNAHTRVQAFRVGPLLHGVQFHPEITAAMQRDIIDAAVERGDVPPETRALKDEVRDTSASMGVLQRFLASLP